MELPLRDVDVNGVSITTAVSEAETAELQRLAQGKCVLEVGSAYGYSSIQMALGGAKHVLCVDPHGGYDVLAVVESLTEMRNNLFLLGLENQITMLLARCQVALPVLAKSSLRFPFIFIDGDHSAPLVEHDLTWVLRLVANDGVVAFHDYGDPRNPGVEEALRARYPDGPTRLIDTLWVLQT